MPEGGVVTGLFLKPQRSAPMIAVPSLTLRQGVGVEGNAGPSGETPRQVTIGIAASLRAHGVSDTGARSNVIVETTDGEITAGSLMALGDVILRVTMACEPCSHGAGLANAPMPHFRQIERYLAVVVHGGVLCNGATFSSQLTFPQAPDDFRSRCAWALDFVPTGKVVTAPDFLIAIGAGPTYARTLPRWLSAAKAQGKPVHRVLASGFQTPSWCPDAETVLKAEGVNDPSRAQFNLTQALWF